MESVIRDKPFGRIIKNMCDEAKNVCSVLYNSAYYLDEKEQPFSDFPILLYLLEKKPKLPALRTATEMIVLLEILSTPLVKL